jgi:hypothetical protein
MRCVDCLAVVEEYFDGELEAETAAQVAAHLPACAECAAALEALEAEQAAYLSYDRQLEVTPALWERVRAEIARTAVEATPAPVAAPRARLRSLFETAFAALALRPALASSLALVVFGLAAASLLFKASDLRTAPAPQIAENGGRSSDDAARAETPGASGQVADAPVSADASAPAPSGEGDGAYGLLATSAPRSSRAGAGPPGAPPPGPGTLGAPPTVAAAGDTVAPPDPDHLELAGGELLPLVRAVSFEAEDPAETAANIARLLDPEEKEVARHVERAQMLLRSFGNTRSAEVSEDEVAYERELSRKLLQENVALRAEAEATGDKATGRVLEAIQPFLLDIANMREKPSRQEMRSIKERVRQTEIVAALQVY